MIIVYDIALEKTFQKIPTWLKDVDKFAAECKIKVLIGNKTDRKDDRMVTKKDGQHFAKSNNITVFLETSAKVVEICVLLSLCIWISESSNGIWSIVVNKQLVSNSITVLGCS